MDSRRWDFSFRDDMNKFYVYAHYKTGEKDIPFYIGKGFGERAYKKSGKDRNKWWHNIVNKHGREVRLLAENLSENDAFWLETHLIGMFGRADLGNGPLVNLTNGGEGNSGRISKLKGSKRPIEFVNKTAKSNTGKKRTLEQRKTMSDSRRGYRASEETKMKQSVSMKGKNTKKGRKLADSTKVKIGNASRGNTYRRGWPSPMKGKKHTEQAKEKNRKARLLWWERKRAMCSMDDT